MKSPSPVTGRPRNYPLMSQRPVDGWHSTPFTTLYSEGVKIFQVDATFAEDYFHPELRAWHGPDHFDYSVQERYWTSLLKQCPDARLCLRVYAGSPPWWDETHVDQLQCYSDGSWVHDFQRTDRTTLPSLASGIWRRDARTALLRFLDWLSESGWKEKVWGIFLCYGITWEWGILGSDRFLDYSEPMRKTFHGWLRRFYREEKRLRAAWGDAELTFDTAAIPDSAARLAGEGGFRIFPRDRPAFDFQRCLSDCNVDYALGLGATVRERCGSGYTLGIFYGYTLTAREHSEFTGRYGPGGLQGGHHGFARFLAEGIYDYVASPYAYGDRSLHSGCLIQHFPLASAQFHGLHVYDENDLWTFSNPPAFEGSIDVGATRTRQDSITHQRLALAQSLCRGTSLWWTELTEWIGPYAPNFSDPQLLEELGSHVRLFQGDPAAMRPRTPADSRAEIALVVDEVSKDALALDSKHFLREVYEQLSSWSWCGAPFDIWLASDVCEATMRPYKLVYVWAPYLDQPLRAGVQDALCHSKRTVWWGAFTGLFTPEGRDEAGFRRLTGHCDPENDHPIREMEMGRWNSLYGGCAGLESTELRDIARKAGVSLYTDKCALVMASSRFVAIHVREKGTYRIHLPNGVWRDVFTGGVAHEFWEFETLGLALFRREESSKI